MMTKRIISLVCTLALVSGFWFLVAGYSSPVRPARAPKAVSPKPVAVQAVPLIINEYLADPAGSASGDLEGDANGDGNRNSSNDEFIELVNTGASPLSISGFTIWDNDALSSMTPRYTIPAGRVIPAGEAAVIFGGGAPTGDFGNSQANMLVFAVGGGGLSLNNNGDTITIKDNLGATLVTLIYGSSEGNANQSITRNPDKSGGFTIHSAAAGSNGALFSPGTRVNGSPFTTTDPIIDSISPEAVVAGTEIVELFITGSNFQNGSQAQIDGSPVTTRFLSATELSADVPAFVTNSPGAHLVTIRNPDLTLSNPATFTVLAPVGINEFLADPPAGPAGDANGDGASSTSQDEFIEIVNRTDAPFGVGGFSIRDADAVRFTFPGSAVIPAGESAVVFGGGRPTGEFGNASFNGLVFTAALSLNNTGDTITLRDSTGGVIESIVYTSAEGNANQSINRNPDVAGVSFAQHSSIAGSAGRLFSPGAQVNGEPFGIGPRIIQITPDRVPFNSPPFDLVIQGSGFDGASIVLIDFAPVAVTPLNSSTLIARIPQSVTSAAGPHSVQVVNFNGNRSNVLTLTIIPPPPLLTMLLPRFAIVGTGNLTLFLIGLNFEPQSVALVEGAPVATVFINARELRATVPAMMLETIGSRPVQVKNGDGQTSNVIALEVIAQSARITSIQPAQALAGGPSFQIGVLGSNFKSGAAVYFDESPLETRFRSSAELTADVPATLISRPGLHGVTVRNSDGGGSNEVIFQVLPDAPVIRSISPDRIIEGSGESLITITGEKFQPGAVASVIEQSRSITRLETAIMSSERLEARLPARLTESAGSVSLRVENPDFGVSNEAVLKVIIRNPLVINEYLADPPDGLSGDANGDGSRSAAQDEFIEIVNRTAEPMDISGYRLSDADAVRHVFAARTIVPPFEAVVVFGGGSPAGRFGNAADNNLVLRASSGGLSLNNGGDVIRLEDAGGHLVQEVRFGAIEGGANQSLNRDPDADGAIFSLHTRVAEDTNRIFSPGAKAAGEPFTTKPVIRSLAPESIRVNSMDFALLISGSDFVPGAMALFNQTELVTIHVSSGELEARVTSDLLIEGGAVEIRVRNPKGELSSVAKFTITDDPPRASSISPQKTGTGAENLEINISGERFQRGAKVMIEGEAVETRYISPIAIAATLPAKFFNQARLLEARVMNGDGNLSNGVMLEVENGPLITRLSRSRIKAGRGEVELTIGGVAFKPDVLLFVNDSPVATAFVSDTEFAARIPAALTATPQVLTVQARHTDGGKSNKAGIRIVE